MTIKYLICQCGEEVYENDRGDATPGGFIRCRSCKHLHRHQDLIDFTKEDFHEPLKGFNTKDLTK